MTGQALGEGEDLKMPRKDVLRRYVKAGVAHLKKEGLCGTWIHFIRHLKMRRATKILGETPWFTDEELERQRLETFPQRIKFSIAVPLYNTPERFLREMIQSVLNQTYRVWELCLADGSDNAHTGVESVCREYARMDSRVKYRKLERNLGISGNTNACLDMADGDCIGLLDHDDQLHPAALYEVMRAFCELNADFVYTDEGTFTTDVRRLEVIHAKPDFAPDTLRANNYICHFSAFRRELLTKAGGFDPACDGSQDYDMVLRLTEQAKRIVHVPEVLYYWRAHSQSVAAGIDAKPYAIEAAHRALEKHLVRVGLDGQVLDSAAVSCYRIRYAIKGSPLVSVLIPVRGHKAELKRCLNSLYNKTTYRNFEVILLENDAKSSERFAYYEEAKTKWKNLRVAEWSGKSNRSAVTGRAAGEYLLLLNQNTKIITPDWIQEMLMFAQRKDVGAVGAKLYCPGGRIQHGGVGLGIGGIAANLYQNCEGRYLGYMNRLSYAQNLSAVSAACMMVRRDVWEKVGGPDESFEVAYQDVDLCMRIRGAGHLIVWTPFAELCQYASADRRPEKTPEGKEKLAEGGARFRERWSRELALGDPYVSPLFTRERNDFCFLPPALARKEVEKRKSLLYKT